MIKIIVPTTLLAISLCSCKSKQVQQDQSNAINTAQLDSVVNSIEPTSIEPENKIYRASVTRINDILHTKLEVSFDWQNAWLIGKATIDIKPHFYSTDKLYLDARGMEIYKVQLVKDKSVIDLNYKYENDSIKIQLDKTYSRDEKYTVFIDYKSKPNDLKTGGSAAIQSDKGLYFINPKGETPNKMPQIWTQGETQSNSVWFPTIDNPNERMTDEILITVDDKYTTLSNGILVLQTKNANGTRTDHWKMDMPHAPYLVMMGIGEFKKVTDKSWNGKEISYYVEKEFEPHAKAIFGNTPEMISFFSSKLGVPYAWPKYAQIVARDYVSGAMENTSATLHGDFVYQTKKELIDGSNGEDVISHELFHQWFGDLVTCESWSNLPLNESFATYGEYLWEEYKYGLDAADAHSYSSRMGYFAEAAQTKKDMIRYDVINREDMFDAHSYNKGGQILHMLRKYVGDDAFFSSLKLYLEKNKFKTVEIHDLRLAFEEVTGEDLNWFFNQWFLAKGHPDLDVKYTYIDSLKTVRLTTKQTQDLSTTPLYKLPVFIDLYFGEGNYKKVKREKITLSKVNQEFDFKVETAPSFVNFDADKQLLAVINEDKTIKDFIYQYKHAPLFLDRNDALEAFRTNLDEPGVYETVVSALNDKWYGHRLKAISILNELASKKENELKPLFIKLANTDSKTLVRAEAIEFLSKNYSGDDLISLFQNKLSDSSYAVMGSALMGLAKNNPDATLKQAKQFESESANSIRYALMDLYSKHGSDENNTYFVSIKNEFSGFERFGFMNLYGSFLKRCTEEKTIISGAEYFKETAKNESNIYVKSFAQRALKSMLSRYKEQESTYTTEIEKLKKENKNTDEMQNKIIKIISTKEKLQSMYDSIK
jgi:aminopeptidase N